MKKFFLMLAVLMFGATPAFADEPLHVIASFSILGDMVQQIGGSDVTVETLVGPNGDTHVYEPTPADAKTLAGAKILFVNGLGFEGWMPRLAAASGFKGQTVVVSNGVKPRQMKPEPGVQNVNAGSETIDPHAWQDLSNGIIYARNIALALEQAMPDKAHNIEIRAKVYEGQLKVLDDRIKKEIAAIPADKRKIITSHDAFGYFGAAYGVDFMAPAGISTEAEPSAAAMAKLIDQMKKQGIKIVFLENMTSPRLAHELVKDGGGKLGDELYSDALSEPDGPAPTYLAMFENNVPKLEAAMKENGT